jgi:hypothetical protein
MGDDGGIGMQPTRMKLALCQKQLVHWSARKHGDADKVLKRKTKQLEILQRQEGEVNLVAIQTSIRDIDFILE